jgi:hypothetical protein
MSVKTMEPTITYGSLNATEAAAYYARLKTYFNSVGLWDKLDMIHTFGTPTEELAKINWKNYG